MYYFVCLLCVCACVHEFVCVCVCVCSRTGYDMSAYSAMYPPSGQGMGTYSAQTASAYGPSRGGYGAGGSGGADKDKDRTSARGYHPYRR